MIYTLQLTPSILWILENSYPDSNPHHNMKWMLCCVFKEMWIFGFYMVLTTVYSNQEYWIIGLFPSSSIYKHNISETASVSVFRFKHWTPTLLGTLPHA
jgi:hypothetical protein